MRTFLMMLGAAVLAFSLPCAVMAQTTPSPAAPPPPAAAAQPTPVPAQTAAPAGASVYIIAPTNGARVRGPVTVRFGLKGMGVTQAGSAAKNAGHHHLLVDVTEPLDPGQPIPADKNHLHFGGGQTETTLDLPPGRHTLQLVLGDAGHHLFNPTIESAKINVTVLSPTAAKPYRKHRRPVHHRAHPRY